MLNKTQQVLEHLESNSSITSWEAITLFRATRLSGIIYRLRRRGYDISSKTETNGDTRYARYILEKNKEERGA